MEQYQKGQCCPKCGGDNLYMDYRWDGPWDDKGEYLYLKCHRCSYAWEMLPGYARLGNSGFFERIGHRCQAQLKKLLGD